MKKIRNVFTVLFAALLAFSAFACTGNKYDPDKVQGVSDTEILVGNTAAVSGGYAVVGLPFNAAMEAVFKQVNDAGGIDGRTIKFKHYDDGFDAANGKTFTEKLVEEDKVFALVGHFGTPTVGATIDYIKETGVPAVYYATGISALYDENAKEYAKANVPVQPIYNTEGRIMLARAVKTPDEFGTVTKVGVIFSDDDAGKGMKAGVERQAKDISGVTLKYEQVAATTTDATAAVASIKTFAPDVIILAMNQAPLAATFQKLAEQSVEKPCITSYANASVATLGINTTATGTTRGLTDYYSSARMLYASGWLDIVVTGATDPKASTIYLGFTKEYEDFANLMLSSTATASYYADPYAMAGYCAAKIFVTGLERVAAQTDKTLTWKTYLDALESTKVHVPMGGDLDFSNGQRLGITSMNLSVFRKGSYTGADANSRPFVSEENATETNPANLKGQAAGTNALERVKLLQSLAEIMG